MDQQPQHHRPPNSIHLRSLVGTIMLCLGIITWLALIYAIFGFSAAVGEFLEIVMSLAGSAK